MTAATVPSGKEVRDLLAVLLGRDVDVAPGEPLKATLAARCSTAVIVNDKLRMTGVLSFDLALTAYLGAALGLLRPHVAQAAIDNEMVTDRLFENFSEVANVLSSLMSPPGAPHQRLYKVYSPQDITPSDISQAAASFGDRLDLIVRVDGYGRGGFSLAVL